VIYTRFLGDAAITVSLLKHLRLLSTPLVVVPASTGGDGSDVGFLASLPFRRWLVRLLDRQCNAINLIAPAMAVELRAAGFSGTKFAAIPNGVQIHDTRPSSPPHPCRFITVGRVSRQKGLDILIDAMALIPDQLQPGLVRIVGDGPERPALQAQAERLGVAHALQWLGELGHGSVLATLGQSMVFLLPSRYEGMSNAGLEAMERGLAMLMSRCGGLDAHIRADMGWVVSPEDPDSLATALSEAITSPPPVLSSMGERNRAYALQHFDLEVVAARYLDLFTSLHRQESVKFAHDQHHRSRLP
jgi:glycosyltransferase involved in cell wall biosynthesis